MAKSRKIEKNGKVKKNLKKTAKSRKIEKNGKVKKN